MGFINFAKLTRLGSAVAASMALAKKETLHHE